MERVVKRSELLSDDSSADLISPEHEEVNATISSKRFEFVSYSKSEGITTHGIDEPDEEGLDFRLFANPHTGTNAGPPELVARIRLQSPQPSNGESGFISAHRDRSFYFADTRHECADVAVSGQDIHALSRIPWVGSACPWKLMHVPTTRKQRMQVSHHEALFQKVLNTESNSGHKRKGKKARLKVRKQLAVKIAKHNEERAAAKERELAEQEKRTRRNREKKVKKKLREKAKKVDAAMQIDNAEDSP